MELLDALERKVNALLDEVASLRAEKTRLEKKLATNESGTLSKDYTEQEQTNLARIKELEKELAGERALNGAVLKRIDALVRRLATER